MKKSRTSELLICEGWFKALAAAQAGYRAVGVVGCYGWRDPETQRMRAELTALIKPGLRVCPLLDADARTNSQVASALAGLCAAIREVGGVPVLRFLPDLGDGATGIDDMLAAQGAKAFDALPVVTEQSPEFREITARIVEHTELGLAEAFIRLHGDDVRHDVRTGEFFTWSGMRWIAGEHEPAERMKSTVRRFGEFARSERNGDAAEALQKFAVRCQSAKIMSAALGLARTDPRIGIDSSQFDQRPEYFGVQNGVLNLETGEILPPAREHMVTQYASVAFDPKAKAPEFERFVARAQANDPEMMKYQQTLAGATLAGRPLRSFVAFAYSQEGGTGKTTVLEILNDIHGDHAVSIKSSVLLRARQDRDPEAPTPERVRLRGKRLATVSEFARERMIDSTVFKDMVGGDRITARGLNRDTVEFRNAAIPLVRTNHLPLFDLRDSPVWDRVRLWPMTNVIPPEERDADLRQRIVANEGPGVLNWLFRGYRAYAAAGFRVDVPAKVRAMLDEHRAASDVLGRWLDENVELLPDGRESQRDVYQNFVGWARENGHEAVSSKNFWADMRARLRREITKKTNGAMVATGLRLVSGTHVKDDVLVRRTLEQLAQNALTPAERREKVELAKRFAASVDAADKARMLREFEQLAERVRADTRKPATTGTVVDFPSRDSSDSFRGGPGAQKKR